MADLRRGLLIVLAVLGILVLVTLIGQMLDAPRRVPLVVSTPCAAPGGALDVAPEQTWQQLC